ncbi:hypothetical protein TRIUR3_25610 [Triticum urartu]|uniref:Uncharacterized protein n=1 Tax=Triticum urartu TaxID=4572 RepID=M7YFL0_TRIUA|nr:hypothetical protein TRIUR3_25610 [Triticum urartu]
MEESRRPSWFVMEMAPPARWLSTVVSDDPSKEATESSDYFLVVCRELSTTARHLELSERKPNLHHADMLHDERAFVIPHTQMSGRITRK